MTEQQRCEAAGVDPESVPCPTCGAFEVDGLLRSLLREVSYVSKGPAHRAALAWLERNSGESQLTAILQKTGAGQ